MPLAAALIKAPWAFDKAVQVALDFQCSSPDKLVIVCSDHETGRQSPIYAWRDLSSTSGANIFSIGVPQLKMLGQINMSILVVAEKLGKKPAPEALDA